MFLHGCSDRQDLVFCLFELTEKPPWPCEQSLGQKRLRFGREQQIVMFFFYDVRDMRE